MLKRVYYFEPCPLAPVLRQLPGASRSGRPSRSKRTVPERYQVIPIDRKGGERPQWELPAVIIADAGEDELEGIEKIAPEEDEWRVIYLLRGGRTPWFGSSQRVFALLPDGVPLVVIEKALERAFESLRYVTEQKQARRELNRAAADLEALNAKKRAEARLVSDARVEQEVISFSKHDEQLAESLASQAAVALENNRLYRDIQNQFEGFVRASIKAIELRDPTTSGHSERVAALTVRLAEVVDRATIGPYAEVSFSPGDLQELKYASLLHDFGKVGVREHLLVKAKKLYPSQRELIEERFLAARRGVELERARTKLDC